MICFLNLEDNPECISVYLSGRQSGMYICILIWKIIWNVYIMFIYLEDNPEYIYIYLNLEDNPECISVS